MASDPHAAARDAVFATVYDGPGESDPALRRAVRDQQGVPRELQPLVEKIHRHAYKVTDEDIAAAQRKYGDDRMFELVVSAAIGAARKRLVAGLRALEEA